MLAAINDIGKGAYTYSRGKGGYLVDPILGGAATGAAAGAAETLAKKMLGRNKRDKGECADAKVPGTNESVTVCILPTQVCTLMSDECQMPRQACLLLPVRRRRLLAKMQSARRNAWQMS